MSISTGSLCVCPARRFGDWARWSSQRNDQGRRVKRGTLLSSGESDPRTEFASACHSGAELGTPRSFLRLLVSQPTAGSFLLTSRPSPLFHPGG